MSAEDGDVVSMIDVLEDDAALEEEAIAVLGGSDDKNCTYPLGYVDRQALYSCQTCTMKDDELAGVCLACSNHCHEGHTLVELYTKRNFSCDCGNSKFTEAKCKLVKDKSNKPTNENNKYNHNFSGRYCTCDDIYPNPDDEIEDEMIQCIICEDWFHSRHLGTLSPVEFQEMTCDGCMVKLPFLIFYANSDDCAAISKPTLKSEKEEQTVDVTSSDEKTNECKLRTLKETQDRKTNKAVAVFWRTNWRQNLCTCSSCKDLYTSFEVDFLTNESDTVSYYEQKGEAKSSTTYENAMEALDSMDRTQKIEVLHEFNFMKTELSDYLKTFAESGKVVKKEDIDEFFSQLNARKRPRLEIPQHCR